MKNYIRTALLTLSMGAAAQAAPFMAIGDGAELFVTGQLGVRVDDNIFLGANEEDDLIFDINPGVEITFGKDAQLTGALTIVHAFTNYADNSKLNTNLFNGDFITKYDDGKLKLGFNLGFHELNQNSADIRGLTRRDVFTAGGNAEVEVSQLTSVGAGVAFTHENYKRTGYSDKDDLRIPLNLYYKWTPKVDLSAGYSYRDSQVDIGADATDHYFNVGARGEFTPKLTGRFSIGYTERRLSIGGDKSLPGLDASLSYELSPKTSLQFGATNDFDTSPQGAQQENFTLNVAATTKISSEWSLNAGLSWREIDYGTRSDDYWEAQLGASYIISSNVRLTGGYVHRDYSAGSAAASASDFKNNVFSIAANFRY